MRRAICAAAALVGVLVVAPSPATAQVLSPGCQALNDPTLDVDNYAVQQVGPLQFFQGETFLITAGPSAASPTGSFDVFLTVPPGPTVSLGPANYGPGSATISFTFGDNVVATVGWIVITGGTPDWTVSCAGAAAYPLAVSDPQPATDHAVPAPAVTVASSGRADFPVVAASIIVVALLTQLGLWAATSRRRRLLG